MERLLADAQKITGIEYNIDNLADVYNAIHVIQGELDITGTTAEEAASTISGSMSAMKSAFKNVLGNLTLGQDIGPSLNALVETTTTFLIDNLLPAVWNIIEGLPGALYTFVKGIGPRFFQMGMELIENLSSGLAQNIPALLSQALPMMEQFSVNLRENAGKLVDAGLNLIVQLVQGLINGLPDLIAYIPTIITNIAGIINDNLPKILSTGIQIIGMLIKGIIENIPNLIANAGKIVEAVFSVIQAFNWLGLGKNVVKLLAQGIKALLSLPGQIMKNIAQSVYDTFKNGFKWVDLGKNIIQGIVNGIKGAAEGLVTAATNAAKSALNAVKGFLGIKSPSKVFENQVGKFIPAGLAKGIEKNLKPVKEAMTDMTKMTAGSFETDMVVNAGRKAGTLNSALETERGTVASMGGVNINIYPSENQDPKEIAEEVSEILTKKYQRLVGAYA